MNDEKPLDDDPLIRRIASVRPSVPEDDLSPKGRRARAIVERVLATPPASPAPRLRRTRPRWTLPRMGLALVPVVAAVIALGLVATFRGPGGSGTQPAAAAVIRAAVRALNPLGAIFIETETYVSGARVHGHPYTLHQVTETPAGPGSQNVLTTTDDPHALAPHERMPMAGWSYVGGEQAFYIAATNTIYESSIWGPYLHRGTRPGTFVYRYARGASTFATHPVTVTAQQRRALLKGQAAILLTSKRVGSKVKIGPLKVQPPERGQDYTQYVRDAIANHVLHFAGQTKVDGRPALELAGKTTDATAPELHIYLNPETHLPFEEIDSVGTRRQQVIHISLRRLPITVGNERLLSLHALHPNARIDRSHEDYLRAAHGVQIFPG
jgi:hypothetical protein